VSLTTVLGDQMTRHHAELVGLTNRDQSVLSTLGHGGLTPDATNQVIDLMVTAQGVMLSTNQVMTVIGFIFAASVILLAPKLSRALEPGSSGH